MEQQSNSPSNSWITIYGQYKDPAVEIPMEVIKLLADNEVKAGGPYCNPGTKELSIEQNIAIYLLLYSHGISLEPLSIYLKENISEVEDSPLTFEYWKIHGQEKASSPHSYIWDKLRLSSSSFLDKLQANTFTVEVIEQPFELNDVLSLNLSLKTLNEISLTNIYGWIYFAILDMQLDGDGKVTKQMKALGKEALKAYTERLGKNPNIKWIADAEGVMRKESKDISEQNSNIRSRPSYLAMSPHLSPEEAKALDGYYLAKQYNDDLHDFLEDIDAGRNTLINSRVTTQDPEEEYVNKIMPWAYERMEEIFKECMPILSGYPPLDKLVKGFGEYKEFRGSVDTLLSSGM